MKTAVWAWSATRRPAFVPRSANANLAQARVQRVNAKMSAIRGAVLRVDMVVFHLSTNAQVIIYTSR
jgi:hypothetical protein